MINEKIFKAYDIRGVYPDDLNEETAYLVGRAFCAYVKPIKIIIGHDMRLSGPALYNRLSAGVVDSGVDVLYIGQVSTDVYYHACASLNLPGIFITASHNPKEYNGFKMVNFFPYFIGGGMGMEEIKDLVIKNDFPAVEKAGTIEEKDVWAGFQEKILSVVNIKNIKPLKIVIDAGNGMGGVVWQQIAARLPVMVIPMYFIPDGSFPHHGGDPLQEENRRELQSRVVAEGADLGLAWDGDGDRFFAVDDRGVFVSGDFLTAILSTQILTKYPDGKILYDLRASDAVPDLVRQAGGKPLINRVGHVYFKKRIAEEGAVFGGEVTGHYYFKDFYGADSGVLPALYLLEYVSSLPGKFSNVIKDLESKYFISGEINNRVANIDAKIKEIAARYRDADRIEYLDGISIYYPDWHCNIRPSNTEPLLRLNLEAKTKELMIEKRDEVLRIITGF